MTNVEKLKELLNNPKAQLEHDRDCTDNYLIHWFHSSIEGGNLIEFYINQSTDSEGKPDWCYHIELVEFCDQDGNTIELNRYSTETEGVLWEYLEKYFIDVIRVDITEKIYS